MSCEWLGKYEDEGVLQKEWVQCVNTENCGAKTFVMFPSTNIQLFCLSWNNLKITEKSELVVGVWFLKYNLFMVKGLAARDRVWAKVAYRKSG